MIRAKKTWLIPVLGLLTIHSCATHRRTSIQKTEKKIAAKRDAARLNGRGQVTSVSLTDFYALQQSGKVLLYDARPRFFYHLGHLPAAIHLLKSDCDEQIAKNDADIKAAVAAKKTIVVYCTNRLCPDARTVAIHLADFGYSAAVLEGGWETWKESGLPTE
jgi:rhodanese-related sulfurtransferase